MKITSFRRQLLDIRLNASVHMMKGRVLDIGGQREKRRGEFLPPLDKVSSWEYLNIDESTRPDYCCSAEAIPVDNEQFDTVMLIEVLEHLERPEQVLREATRMLRPGGAFMLSTPFLYPIHGAPHDYQRWTDTRLIMALSAEGLVDIKVAPMGGPGAVVHDLLMVSARKIKSKLLKRLVRLTLFLGRPAFKVMDTIFGSARHKVTSGFFVTARKPA